MSIVLLDETIRLQGLSAVEDAEVLLGLLQAHPGCPVDVRAAAGLHAAVVQILLALRPAIIGPAGDPFVDRWLLPSIARHPAAEVN